MPMPKIDESLPVCVDLDGTLARVDTLILGILVILFTKPWRLMPLAARFGNKPSFKHYVTAHAALDVTCLPLHTQLRAQLESLANAGSELHLVTGASHHLAAQVADFCGIFAASHGTTQTNLTGSRKANFLRERFGSAFIYAGNAPVDLKVWQVASQAIVVGSTKLLKAAESHCQIVAYYPKESIFGALGAYWEYFHNRMNRAAKLDDSNDKGGLNGTTDRLR